MPPARVLNIGNHRSEQVSTLVRLLEQALGRQAIVREAPRPPADVEETFASIDAIAALTGFAPRTSLEEGIPRFVAWFKAWHGHRRISLRRALTAGSEGAYIALPPHRAAGFASCLPGVAELGFLFCAAFGRTSEQASRWARSCGAVGRLRSGL